MPRLIAKFGELYCEWSTVVDAPVTHLMTQVELRAYMQAEYGDSGVRNLDERLARVEQQGTSCRLGTTVQNLLNFNRAGPNEAHIGTLEEMVTAYTAPPEEQPAA